MSRVPNVTPRSLIRQARNRRECAPYGFGSHGAHLETYARNPELTYAAAAAVFCIPWSRRAVLSASRQRTSERAILRHSAHEAQRRITPSAAARYAGTVSVP